MKVKLDVTRADLERWGLRPSRLPNPDYKPATTAMLARVIISRVEAKYPCSMLLGTVLDPEVDRLLDWYAHSRAGNHWREHGDAKIRAAPKLECERASNRHQLVE